MNLEDDITLDWLVKNGSLVPTDSDALPTYRVYDGNELVANQTGTMAFTDSGDVTGATNASPIVITSAGHGLSNGTRVTLSGVGGNTAANSTFAVANVTTNTFELAGSTGNGSYTSGGSWHVTGLYSLTLTASAANGYVAGITYTVLVSGAVSASARADLITFIVG